jgi:hypothetical protein
LSPPLTKDEFKTAGYGRLPATETGVRVGLEGDDPEPEPISYPDEGWR